MKLLGFLIRLIGAALVASHAGAHQEPTSMRSGNQLGDDLVPHANMAVEAITSWRVEAASP